MITGNIEHQLLLNDIFVSRSVVHLITEFHGEIIMVFHQMQMRNIATLIALTRHLCHIRLCETAFDKLRDISRYNGIDGREMDTHQSYGLEVSQHQTVHSVLTDGPKCVTSAVG